MLWLLWGCVNPQRHLPVVASHPLDVIVVPGCPTDAEGALSPCLWQRVLWAHHLFSKGLTRHFVVSGNAVHNRYIEAEALKAGLVSMGVPEEVIFLETQAPHTDENAGFSLLLSRHLGFERIGIASHRGQANGMRAFIRGWGFEAESLPMDVDWVEQHWGERIETRVEPIPASEWLEIQDRERVIAERLHRPRRPSSLWLYTWDITTGWLRDTHPPEPPTPEPSLRGIRHRVDTQPWDGVASP